MYIYICIDFPERHTCKGVFILMCMCMYTYAYKYIYICAFAL